ncbi:hypothetical protein DMH12_27700 [Streptomyces sp. WAC 04229]|nr:hypothetical protein DMH12_27700 [Streptomyces sp. WAC 04229]
MSGRREARFEPCTAGRPGANTKIMMIDAPVMSISRRELSATSHSMSAGMTKDHRRRRQRRLGRLTPVEYETIMTPPAALAA